MSAKKYFFNECNLKDVKIQFFPMRCKEPWSYYKFKISIFCALKFIVFEIFFCIEFGKILFDKILLKFSKKKIFFKYLTNRNVLYICLAKWKYYKTKHIIKNFIIDFTFLTILQNYNYFKKTSKSFGFFEKIAKLKCCILNKNDCILICVLIPLSV